jgi:ABC-type glycerol-3-phosphate transport system substrate-binding protein
MNEAPNMAYIGWGVYVMARVEGDEKKRKAAWSAAAHLGGKDLSLWASAYPSGFQPYRNSHFNYDEWEEAGYDRAFVEDYLGSNLDSYNHPNAAIEPRIPGIFQYYSVAEDELAKGFAGQYGSAQETADAIAAAWERSPTRSAARARSRSTRPRWACSGQLAGLAGARRACVSAGSFAPSGQGMRPVEPKAIFFTW